MTWILNYPRGSFADLLRWLFHPYIQLWGSLGQVQNEGNAGQAWLLITCILNVLYCLSHTILKLWLDFAVVSLIGKCQSGKCPGSQGGHLQGGCSQQDCEQGVLERHCLGLTGLGLDIALSERFCICLTSFLVLSDLYCCIAEWNAWFSSRLTWSLLHNAALQRISVEEIKWSALTGDNDVWELCVILLKHVRCLVTS